MQDREVDPRLLEKHMCAQRMGLIELVGQDFRHRDRRPFSDPLHRRNLHRQRLITITRSSPQRQEKAEQTSDSMMLVGMCESATRAMR